MIGPFIGPDLRVGVKQGVILTHALKQALKLLQMPQIELSEWLEYQIEKNPLLEKIESSSWAADKDKHNFFLQNIPENLSLFSKLMQQARFSFTEKEMKIAETIIGNVNEKGLLDISLEEMDFPSHLSKKEIHRILKIIQTFDPPGVAAKNTKEALLMQLKLHAKEDSLAFKIIENHFHDLLNFRFKKIEKAYNLSPEHLVSLIKTEISTLDPFPGNRDFAQIIPLAIPDIIYSENGNGLSITINGTFIPKFRFNPHYRNIFIEHSLHSEEKKMIRFFLSDGNWLLKSIEKRREYLLQLAEFLLKEQKEFLLGNHSSIKPITLRETANHLKINESTMTRIVQNKYIEAPIGVYPLRKFFSHKLKKVSGELISNQEAKSLLLKFIQIEKETLSDMDLSKKLSSQGIILSRRTIGKYRKELNIANSAQRKIILKE